MLDIMRVIKHTPCIGSSLPIIVHTKLFHMLLFFKSYYEIMRAIRILFQHRVCLFRYKKHNGIRSGLQICL